MGSVLPVHHNFLEFWGNRPNGGQRVFFVVHAVASLQFLLELVGLDCGAVVGGQEQGLSAESRLHGGRINQRERDGNGRQAGRVLGGVGVCCVYGKVDALQSC